jgi:nucleotide-binding universal stress UspA family protein
MRPITRVLVPTDFSEYADQALAYAVTLADQVGATVHLIHVFDDPDSASLYSEVYVPMPPEMRAALLTDIRRQLSTRTATAGHEKVTTEVLTGAPPAQAIVEAARQNGCDLIVMGTHGRHGMAHLLLGSVAERVVRTAACPVLVVRRPGAQ